MVKGPLSLFLVYTGRFLLSFFFDESSCFKLRRKIPRNKVDIFAKTPLAASKGARTLKIQQQQQLLVCLESFTKVINWQTKELSKE